MHCKKFIPVTFGLIWKTIHRDYSRDYLIALEQSLDQCKSVNLYILLSYYMREKQSKKS